MKRMTALLLAVLMAFSLTACGAKEETAPPRYDVTGRFVLSADGEAVMADDTLHSDYATDDNARVFYEIFVGSFSDSDGDGIGDLRGIIDRMDYLNDGDPDSGLSLGVEGLWLTPIFKSLSYHKYDVEDFYAVDPQFGTMEDLQELIDLCHQRNVKLILDLPINHTSSQNAWFKAFCQARKTGDTSDPYYSFYSHYTKGDKTSHAGRTFSIVPGTNTYYECNFSRDMPELDFESFEVNMTMLDVAYYYLDMGVDGFRFDAAKYIYFGDHRRSEGFWEWYIGKLRERKPGLYTVAEVWDGSQIVDLYSQATNCFDFAGSQREGVISSTAMRGDVNAYTRYVQGAAAFAKNANPDGMLVPFITNHDMDRASGFLSVSNGDMKMAANLYILSSGSPFIYYGEEIGLKGSRGSANTDANRRLAMRWGDGDTVADPEGSTYDKQTDTTVAIQREDADSLYSYYKRLIMIRKANPEIARGDYTALDFRGTKLGGFTAAWNGSEVCVLHNTTSGSLSVTLADAGAERFDTVTAMIGAGDAVLDGGVLTLDSQTSVVLRPSN